MKCQSVILDKISAEEAHIHKRDMDGMQAQVLNP